MAFDQDFFCSEVELEIRLMVENTVHATDQRVSRVQTRQGSVVWIKRVERFSAGLWLVKGAPEKAFARDRAAREFLWRRGVPVPAMVAEGDDFIALEDAGPSLTKIYQDRTLSVSEKATACREAGRALARLHAENLAHGRPAFRDMCWDGAQIRFIDFEYFSPSKAGVFRKARDLLVTTISALAQGVRGPRCAYLVLRAYAEAAIDRPNTRSVRTSADASRRVRLAEPRLPLKFKDSVPNR